VTTPATSDERSPVLPEGRPIYVARQPIFDAEEKVFAYELLFRDGTENYFRGSDTDAASRRTLDSSFQIGLESLCEGHRAFLNCTREVLLKDYITLLPAARTVVEVLESVPADDLVRAALQRHRRAGYLIALDDFVFNDPRESLVEVADIIKVDMQLTTAEERTTLVGRHGSSRLMLAEKVETREQFAQCEDAGFTYFQGYFFQKPELMQAKEIPANRLNYMRLLQAISQPELDMRGLETLIKHEASVCYRLLRYLNSAAFGIRSEVHSIRHAIAMLGEREIRRWIRLVATLNVGESKPGELVNVAMSRARFCELLSRRIPHCQSDLFLMGLLSMIDVILEIPMTTVLRTIPVDADTSAVLLGEKSRLTPIYRLMVARETGDWEQIAHYARTLELSELEVAEAYWHAVGWARQLQSVSN
jgi:EAL and modified HD-GYP domain-containing signal transduction protein